ncbi:MAG: bifunctional UDP-N-acetylglucosamine diphosphorylase/glucosamine-1-phosphate N-acetyltransferase GlmU [Chloroflexota bacterium]
MKISTVILAAGYGTRMKSKLPKQLHRVAGRTLVEWSVEIANQVSSELPTAVVGHGKEDVKRVLTDRVQYAVQEEQLGTGHAVQQAESLLRGQVDAIIVIYGDMPLLRGETLRGLADLFIQEQATGNLALAMLTVVRDDPQGFGRILRDTDGKISAIVEEAACTAEQLKIRELNPGIYCFDANWLWDNLSSIPLSAKGEYYLTDMVEIAVAQGKRIASTFADIEEVDGINTRIHLAHAEQIMRRRILNRLMLSGVTIVDPDSTYIDDTVSIGQDTRIMPATILEGCTEIGRDCVIGPTSHIIDSQIGDHCSVSQSVVEYASMAEHCDIGPFSHLRKGAILDAGVHLGNFGEVKNSYLGPGTKMGHFSYLGDSHIEGNVNIGAGTITCNFDGENKHKTHIGANSFIGSDTMLVAPISVGKGARTGAGSIVTKDVGDGELVYGVPAKAAAQ